MSESNVGFDDVLQAELKAVESRRSGKATEAAKADTNQRALEMNLLGVGFSGGGIRSATFNLGILQGLAKQGLLPYIDYLSTVSGGGYIGSWLHGILRQKGLAEAIRILDPLRVPEPAQSDPITWLRKYSNYLAPRTGLFSRDTWVLAVIWLRNVLLNQCVLLPAISALLLVPVLLTAVPTPDARIRWIAAGIALAAAVFGMGARLSEVARRELNEDQAASPSNRIDAGWSAVLAFAAAILIGCRSGDPFSWEPGWQIAAIVGLFFLFSVLQCQGWFVECFTLQHKGTDTSAVWAWPLLVLFAGICTVATGLLLIGALRLFPGDAMAMAWGPPIVAGCLMFGVGLLIGLMGADYPDGCREWLSRTAALVLMMSAAWAALFAIGLFAPGWMSSLVQYQWPAAVTTGAAWVATTGFGLFAGRSSKTGDAKSGPTSGLLEVLAAVAPTVFASGYLVLISMGNHAAVTGLSTLTVTGVAIGLFLTALLMNLRVNVNEFSIHHLYKNRLVRCYLGASNPDRRPNSWTGFDGRDDVKLVNLRRAGEKPYEGPYPIINTAVNLNSGAELATQDRKAASFFMTPLFCGFVPKLTEGTGGWAGFMQTEKFMPGGPSLGTATAISGAAANPNMGYHTSGPVAFLLTVFNIRLGWWVGNPIKGEKYTKTAGPSDTLRYLVKELLGQTTATTNYLNLSDGGHFDNLGLYELVRRRCRYVIIGDGEQDAKYAFGSLASAVRRCRADFGIDIDLDFDRIRQKNVHAVVGTIKYPEKTEGIILYLKSSLTGDETEDIREFKSRFDEFPHQSTGDQFFDEPQFESYRQLGLHVASKVFAKMPEPKKELGYVPGFVDELFKKLKQRWYAPSTAGAGVATHHAEAYSRLMERLAADSKLAWLDAAFVPGTQEANAPDPDAARRGRFFCIECIQLMENVFTDLRFSDEAEWTNPANRGWNEVFRQWASMPAFRGAWKEVKETYNCHFRQFFDELQAGQAKSAAGCS